MQVSQAFEVTINDGDATTTDNLVEVLIQAEDATKIMISNEPDFSDASWQAFSPTYSRWNIGTGDGPHTVYVAIRTESSLNVDEGRGTIVLDQNPPDFSGVQLNPADNSVHTATPVSMSWTGVTDAGSGVADYRLVLDEADHPDSLVYSGIEPSCSSGMLGVGKRYYWKVIARDGVGFESESPVWSFTVSLDGFVLIEAGEFLMGSPTDELGRYSNEDLHSVTLTSDFWMSPFEVTEELWNQVTGEGSTSMRAKEWVSWNMAIRFCNTMSTMSGLTPAYTYLDPYECGHVTWNPESDGYRLPTEAEWEYACRAGSQSAFCNGPITHIECTLDPNLDPVGWYCGNMKSFPIVGEKDCNAWGLYDMHGNVYEWCWDIWSEHLGYEPVTNPIGGGYDQASGAARTVRGDWPEYARNCRSAFRSNLDPSAFGTSRGFRLARSAF